MCPRSLWKSGSLLKKRRMSESQASTTGSPKETSGIAIAMIVEPCCEPASESAAAINPRNKAHESPRKIVAGVKL